LLAVVALLGLAVSAWVGHRAWLDAREVEQLRFEQAADARVAELRDHLGTRESLARAVAAMFQPSEPVMPGALAGVDPRLLAVVPDITSFVWAPRVEPAYRDAALRALAGSGVPPAFLGPGRVPIAELPPERVIFPVLDILPATPTNRLTLGLELGAVPPARAALDAAEARRDAAATAPLELVQVPGERALVLYVPVFRAAEGAPIGYLGFSYLFRNLVGAALTSEPQVALGMAITDAAAAEAGVLLAAGAPPAPHLPVTRAEIAFGGRPLLVEHWPAEAPGEAAVARGLAIGFSAATVLLATLAIAAWFDVTARRLTAALAGRDAAEARLRVVIDELNHRTRNMFAVAQALVSRTLSEGGDPAAAKAALTERLRAMASATDLLARGEWRGLTLGEALHGSRLPFAERVRLVGEDPMLAAGAAQQLVLLLHELWTNAAKHGALSLPGGRVEVECRVTEGRFRLAWREIGGPAASLPSHEGFGRQLIERLVPRSVGGEGRLSGGEAGIGYELDAPAERVLAADQAPPQRRPAHIERSPGRAGPG